MQYFIYGEDKLIDVIDLTDAEKKKFEAANPHFELEEVTFGQSLFEFEDDDY